MVVPQLIPERELQREAQQVIMAQELDHILYKMDLFDKRGRERALSANTLPRVDTIEDVLGLGEGVPKEALSSGKEEMKKQEDWQGAFGQEMLAGKLETQVDTDQKFDVPEEAKVVEYNPEEVKEYIKKRERAQRALGKAGIIRPFLNRAIKGATPDRLVGLKEGERPAGLEEGETLSLEEQLEHYLPQFGRELAEEEEKREMLGIPVSGEMPSKLTPEQVRQMIERIGEIRAGHEYRRVRNVNGVKGPNNCEAYRFENMTTLVGLVYRSPVKIEGSTQSPTTKGAVVKDEQVVEEEVVEEEIPIVEVGEEAVMDLGDEVDEDPSPFESWDSIEITEVSSRLPFAPLASPVQSSTATEETSELNEEEVLEKPVEESVPEVRDIRYGLLDTPTPGFVLPDSLKDSSQRLSPSDWLVLMNNAGILTDDDKGQLKTISGGKDIDGMLANDQMPSGVAKAAARILPYTMVEEAAVFDSFGEIRDESGVPFWRLYTAACTMNEIANMRAREIQRDLARGDISKEERGELINQLRAIGALQQETGRIIEVGKNIEPILGERELDRNLLENSEARARAHVPSDNVGVGYYFLPHGMGVDSEKVDRGDYPWTLAMIGSRAELEKEFSAEDLLLAGLQRMSAIDRGTRWTYEDSSLSPNDCLRAVTRMCGLTGVECSSDEITRERETLGLEEGDEATLLQASEIAHNIIKRKGGLVPYPDSRYPAPLFSAVVSGHICESEVWGDLTPSDQARCAGVLLNGFTLPKRGEYAQSPATFNDEQQARDLMTILGIRGRKRDQVEVEPKLRMTHEELVGKLEVLLPGREEEVEQLARWGGVLMAKRNHTCGDSVIDGIETKKKIINGNCLVTGGTGCGKTHGVSVLLRMLGCEEGVISAGSMSVTGYEGKDWDRAVMGAIKETMARTGLTLPEISAKIRRGEFVFTVNEITVFTEAVENSEAGGKSSAIKGRGLLTEGLPHVGTERYVLMMVDPRTGLEHPIDLEEASWCFVGSFTGIGPRRAQARRVGRRGASALHDEVEEGKRGQRLGLEDLKALGVPDDFAGRLLPGSEICFSDTQRKHYDALLGVSENPSWPLEPTVKEMEGWAERNGYSCKKVTVDDQARNWIAANAERIERINRHGFRSLETVIADVNVAIRRYKEPINLTIEDYKNHPDRLTLTPNGQLVLTREFLVRHVKLKS